jgi:hypothetical protein
MSKQKNALRKNYSAFQGGAKGTATQNTGTDVGVPLPGSAPVHDMGNAAAQGLPNNSAAMAGHSEVSPTQVHGPVRPWARAERKS